MKRTFLLFLLSKLFVVCLAQTSQTDNIKNVAIQTVREFRKTSPFLLDKKRDSLLRVFETYSDPYSDKPFKEYLSQPDDVAAVLEQREPILYAYRESFDKVLNEVKTVKVKKGTAVVWLLYNMGFVVKTPSGCFGIDVDHRLAYQLEPYLDFLIVTHNHGDHANVKLMEAMHKKGKPILSNFYQASEKYYSTIASQFKIGEFTITTDISDHLRSENLANFVKLFRIDCGRSAGNFSILHCGDSGFLPERFKNVEGPVDMAVFRWGAPRENDVIGTGEGQIQPKYVLLSHLIELRHKPYPRGQASITQTLKHLPNVKCEHTILPFWGERMTWKKGKLF